MRVRKYVLIFDSFWDHAVKEGNEPMAYKPTYGPKATTTIAIVQAHADDNKKKTSFLFVRCHVICLNWVRLKPEHTTQPHTTTHISIQEHNRIQSNTTAHNRIPGKTTRAHTTQHKRTQPHTIAHSRIQTHTTAYNRTQPHPAVKWN